MATQANQIHSAQPAAGALLYHNTRQIYRGSGRAYRDNPRAYTRSKKDYRNYHIYNSPDLNDPRAYKAVSGRNHDGHPRTTSSIGYPSNVSELRAAGHHATPWQDPEHPPIKTKYQSRNTGNSAEFRFQKDQKTGKRDLDHPSAVIMKNKQGQVTGYMTFQYNKQGRITGGNYTALKHTKKGRLKSSKTRPISKKDCQQITGMYNRDRQMRAHNYMLQNSQKNKTQKNPRYQVQDKNGYRVFTDKKTDKKYVYKRTKTGYALSMTNSRDPNTGKYTLRTYKGGVNTKTYKGSKQEITKQYQKDRQMKAKRMPKKGKVQPKAKPAVRRTGARAL